MDSKIFCVICETVEKQKGGRERGGGVDRKRTILLELGKLTKIHVLLEDRMIS